MAERKYEESDPSGLDRHSPGAKLDAGKQRPHLVLGDFARALSLVAEVGTFGASKYTAHGWLSVERGVERYADAGMRHWLKRMAGELRDPDSGLLHEAHECWNKLAELELRMREAENVGLEAENVGQDI